MLPIIVATREELLAQRATILSKLGCTLEEFNARKKADNLQGKDWDYVNTLSSIEFLLGED